MDKDQYIQAKMCGKAEKYRGDEISRRIAKEYPLSAQIALLMDKDEKPEEWQIYQDFRAQIKRNVDKEISEIESDINTSTKQGMDK